MRLDTAIVTGSLAARRITEGWPRAPRRPSETLRLLWLGDNHGWNPGRPKTAWRGVYFGPVALARPATGGEGVRGEAEENLLLK